MLRELLLRRLAERGLSPVLFLSEETGSTNDDAKRYAESVPEGPVLFAADRQTAGRGRMGRTFVSPPGGMYMSLLLPAPRSSATAGAVSVTGCAAVAACRAVEEVAGIPARIKWVNDILVPAHEDGAFGKAAGILCETTGSGEGNRALVIGIGVNIERAPEVEGANFPPAAVSSPGRRAEPEALCAALTDEFLKIARDGYDFSSVSEEYRARSVVLGRTVRFVRNGRTFSGIARSILRDGSLLVETAEGDAVLNSGEISVRLA